MSSTIIIIFTCALALILIPPRGVSALAELPDFIRPCHQSQSDEELNACIKNSSLEVIPRLVKGVETLGVPVLSPFLISTVNLTAGDSLRFQLVNLTVGGLETAKILDVNTDLKQKHIWAKVYFPNIDFDGRYTIDGKILILPIHGRGDVKVVFDDVRVEFNTDYVLETRGEEEYAKVYNMTIKYGLRRAHYKLDNLFNGDKLLGDRMNKFVNDNWEALHHDFSPYISKSIGEIIMELFALFTDAIPFNKIFLP